ncbi:unnamed protein product, partial [Mesorhabditis belari]|uniref:Uncharacterized protein n=1 Tax=Mesorhabditis belari TaxID=2138241 RepID=A0AAF3ERS5_9BILA
MCDGRNDCPDGSDEHAHVCHQHSAAGSGCFGDQPECIYLGVTRCIMHEWLCDGRTDCDNNIDESNCTHVNVTNPGEKPLLSPINLPSRMQPGVSLAEVIRKNQIMQAGSLNGLPGCQPFEFQCKSSECIIRDLLCDDTKDCPDGSDESEEKCATPPGIPVVEPPHSFPDSAELSTIEPYGELNGLLSPIDINQPKSLPILTSTTLWPNMASFGEIPSPELATEAVERNLVTSTEVIESIDLSTKQETTVENYPQPFLPITGGPPLPPAGLEPMILPSDVNLPQIPVNSIPDEQANENLPQENTPVVESVNPNLFTSTLGMPAIIPLRGLLGIPLPTKLKENDQKTEPIVPFPFVPINQDGDKRETVGNEIPFTASGSPFSVTNVLPDETFGKSRVLSPLAFHQPFPLLKGDSTILCPKGISILFFIHTAPFAFNRRETIRQTWGNKIWQEKFGFKTVFVLGTSKFPDENDQMNREKAQNDDILQFDFIEHYRNLTIKQLSWSRFASQNCRDAKVFVKIDDDVLVNIFWFFKEINVNDFNNTLVCGHECQYHQVWRDKRKPWFVPKEAYEPTLWPRFCSGGLVIESADILPKLVAAVEKRERYISTDDTLFTGILPDELNITKVLASSKFVYRCFWS